MNDLKFALRQLLKNPGFTAVAVLTLGTGGQTPDGYRSKPKSSPRPGAARRRDSSRSRGPTTRAGHFEAFPSAGWDGLGSVETCGRRAGPPVEYRKATPGRAARNLLCLARSRLAIKLGIHRFRVGRRVALMSGLGVIEQRAQGRARARVTDNPFPGCVAIHFWQEPRQIRDEFLAIRRRQVADGCFDFLQRAHGGRLRGPESPRKRSTRNAATAPVRRLSSSGYIGVEPRQIRLLTSSPTY